MTQNKERLQPFDEGGPLRFVEMPYAFTPRPVYGEDVRMVPLWFLKELVKPSLFANIRRLESEYIASLCEDIKVNGTQEPLVISIDDSKVCLRDGHHRVVCATLLEIEELPVRLSNSQGVAKNSLPLRSLVDLMWRGDMLR